MLNEHEAGTKTAEICPKHGLPEAADYNYNAECGDLDVSDVRWLRALEGQNAKLQSLLIKQTRNVLSWRG